MLNLKKTEFKKVRIENRTCHYFDEIIKFEDFDFDILTDEKSHENILIYDISYKTLITPKPLGISFNQIDGVYDGTRYLVLFRPEK